MATILIIDDDPAVRTSISLLLKRAEFRPVALQGPGKMVEQIRKLQPHLVLLDMNFTIDTSGRQGLKALQTIRREFPGLPVILMTGWATVELAVEGMKAGARDFIAKPWENKQLLSSIRTILDLNNKTNKTETAGPTDFDRIVGEDPQLLRIIEQARRVSKTDASVLILGESGTGKELLAEAIHYESRRANAPFVKVNLGGISTSLFESELFGHKKGAFTDAVADRQGRFARADGGTIFLDEIGDLELSSQVKLLRVLQEKTFEELGSSKSQKVDLRVISATNKNLEAMIAKEQFREDLYYRINLIKLEIPPLRERPGDIALLVEHFIDRFRELYERPELTIQEKAIGWLQQQPFPGNIRQLQNLVERTLLIAPGPELSANDFQQHYEYFSTEKPALVPTVGSLSLEEMEIKMIRKALSFYDNNISLAARSLGITRSALYRRLQKYNIPYDA